MIRYLLNVIIYAPKRLSSLATSVYIHYSSAQNRLCIKSDRLVYRMTIVFLAIFISVANTGVAVASVNEDFMEMINAPWYKDGKANCGGATNADLSSVSPGNGAPNGLTYPNLDAQKMADAIEKFVEEKAPNSPLKGTGKVAVASAKQANLSPFLAYAHAYVESGLGTTTISGAQVKIWQGHNVFGRTATPSQPNVSEGGRLWYKWSSFEASLDYSASENQAPGSGGDWYAYDRDVFSAEIDQGISAYINRYAPPSENDSNQYIKNMQGFLDTMAGYAGGDISSSSSNASTSTTASQTTSTTAASKTAQCCATPTAGGSTVVTLNDNPETALGYLMTVGSGQKLTLAQAAGIVGNLQQESGQNLDPKASNGSHTGIAQWDNANRYGGENGLAGFAKYIQANPQDLGTQLRYLAWELTLNNEWSGKKGSYGGALAALQATSTPEEAAAVFEDKFEGSGGSALTERQQYARALYDKYKDVASLSSSSTSATPGSTAACSNASSGSGKLSEYVTLYAWPDGPHGTEKKPEYASAVSTAQSEGRFVGSDGVDCGGFVTTLLYDSGFDKTYNSNAKGGNTAAQQAWVESNWQRLGSAGGTYEPDGSSFTEDKLQPGDVAFVPGHTWIYVGDIPNFSSKYASASLGERAPSAGSEGFSYNSPVWYRSKNAGRAMIQT